MVLFDQVKWEKLGDYTLTPGATLGGSFDVPHEPANYAVELMMRVTKGTFSGGSSPAWTADAGDKLLKKLKLHLGGSTTPINVSVEDLKRIMLLETGEEIQQDGYWTLPFNGAFPWFLMKNGVRLQGDFAALADITTGSPSSQSGTKVETWVKKYPRQGAPKPVVGWPVIKTFEKDLQSVAGEKLVHELNSGNLLRDILIMPSSGTLINSVKVQLDDGDDVLRDMPWDLLREENKKMFFFDAIQGASGFAAFRFPGLLNTDKGAVGKLQLMADINSEASGKIRVVTVERMNPAEEAALLAKLKQ